MQQDGLNAIVDAALADFAACTDPAGLENAKARYLGKAGALTTRLKALGQLPPPNAPLPAPASMPQRRGSRVRWPRGAMRSPRRSSPPSSPPTRSTCRCRDAAGATAACTH